MKIVSMSRRRRYFVAAISALGATAALAAAAGANPFLDLSPLQTAGACNQNTVALAPVTGVGVLGAGSGQGNLNALDLAGTSQSNSTSAPALSVCGPTAKDKYKNKS